MLAILRSSALVAAVSLTSATATAQAPPPPLAIVDVSVIPMDRERVLANQTVLVERGVITRIAPAAGFRIPAGATTVDGKGKYLVPGFGDMHVHLAGPAELQRALLRMFVVNGVTTVLNMRGTPEHLALRTDVAAGRIFGPVITTAGPYVNEPFFRTPDEVEREVREQKRLGYDFVKMHGDLTRESYARLHAVAKQVGIRVIGHAPRNLGIDALFEERQYALAHAEEFLYDKNNSSRNYLEVMPRVPALADSMVKTGTWLMPNLTAYKMIGLQVQDLSAVLARPEMRYLPSPYRTSWGPATNGYTNRFGKELGPGFAIRYKALEQITRDFHARGVRLLIGTDALNTGVVPGFSIHDEMSDLVTAGLTPFHALRAATANIAEFLGTRGARGEGTITAGSAANLVLLDSNPLSSISNTRTISGVVLRGKWISPAEIARMLAELAAM